MLAINTKTDEYKASKFNTVIGRFIGKHPLTIARWKESCKVMGLKKRDYKDFVVYFDN